MTNAEKLQEMKVLWDKVKPIKHNCSNATEDDMEKVRLLVTSYNGFVGRPKLKISACQIPHILHTVAKLLKGHGIIDNVYA